MDHTVRRGTIDGGATRLAGTIRPERTCAPRLLLVPLLAVFMLVAGWPLTTPQAASATAPTITKLSPTTAKRLAKVTISGRNFGARRGASYVKFGATKCTAYIKWSATKIICKVPATAAADKVQVKVTARRQTSKGKPFIVMVPPPRGAWTGIAGGWYHSLGIMHDGSLWAWGRNVGSPLGLGDTIARRTPTRVGTASDWAAVSCGQLWSLAVKRDGSLWAWGSTDNGGGQLGLGDNRTRTTPARVGSASDWVAVSCGGDHVLALKTDGSLWAWGSNSSGQLGLGHIDEFSDDFVPMRVGTDSDWALIAAGSGFSHALKTDGSLWAWGGNNRGQLGLGDWGYGTERATPTRVGSANDWTAISSSSAAHTLAVKRDGSLWTWGDGSFGQLGVGLSGDFVMEWSPTRLGAESDWAGVYRAGSSSFAIKSDGSLWAWGANLGGQLGLGVFDLWRLTPTHVGSSSDWTAISCGGGHTLGLRNDDSLWAWGGAGHGQLGVGSIVDRAAPVRVGGP